MDQGWQPQSFAFERDASPSAPQERTAQVAQAAHAAPAQYAPQAGHTATPVAPRAQVPAARVGVAEGAAASEAYARSSTLPDVQQDDLDLAGTLTYMIEAGASDLHLTIGAPPMINSRAAQIQPRRLNTAYRLRLTATIASSAKG